MPRPDAVALATTDIGLTTDAHAEARPRSRLVPASTQTGDHPLGLCKSIFLGTMLQGRISRRRFLVMNVAVDYHELLGVPVDASEKEIEEARRTRARALHTDLQQDKPPEVRHALEDMLKLVNAAADRLLEELRGPRSDTSSNADHIYDSTTGQGAGAFVELPCPFCEHRELYPDLHGDETNFTCPKCAGSFGAVSGASITELRVADLDGDVRQFSATCNTRTGRRLFQFVGPWLVQLEPGNRLSLVYGPDGLYAISNDSVRHYWTLARPRRDISEPAMLNVGRVAAGLVVFGVVFFGLFQQHVISTVTFIVAALALPPLLARWKRRSIWKWWLAALFTFGAATCVLAFAKKGNPR